MTAELLNYECPNELRSISGETTAGPRVFGPIQTGGQSVGCRSPACGTRRESESMSGRAGRVSFDWQRINESKGAYRRKLAALPIAEKLRLLDAMRERALAIRSASVSKTTRVEELPPGYGTSKAKKL